MKPLERADNLLIEISVITGQLTRLEAQAEAELKAVRERYEGPLGKFKEVLKALDAELIKHMKKHRAEIFDGTDQVNIENGILLYGEEDKVKIPRDAVEKIEAQGWEEALAKTVSVRREVVAEWPEERLVLIGAERKHVETFSYELKEGGEAGMR